MQPLHMMRLQDITRDGVTGIKQMAHANDHIGTGLTADPWNLWVLAVEHGPKS